MSDNMLEQFDANGNVRFSVADSTGRFLYNGTVPQTSIDAQVVPEGGALVHGWANGDTQYHKDGQIVDRPANTATLDGMTLKNLPVPCQIYVEGAMHDCTDDHCDLSFSQPGTYTVGVIAFPMLEAVFQVTQA